MEMMICFPFRTQQYGRCLEKKAAPCATSQKIFIAQSCQTAVTSNLTAAGCSTTGTDSSSFHSSRDVAAQEPKIEFDQSLETEHADIVFIHSSVPGKLLDVAVK